MQSRGETEKMPDVTPGANQPKFADSTRVASNSNGINRIASPEARKYKRQKTMIDHEAKRIKLSDPTECKGQFEDVSKNFGICSPEVTLTPLRPISKSSTNLTKDDANEMGRDTNNNAVDIYPLSKSPSGAKTNQIVLNNVMENTKNQALIQNDPLNVFYPGINPNEVSVLRIPPRSQIQRHETREDEENAEYDLYHQNTAELVAREKEDSEMQDTQPLENLCQNSETLCQQSEDEENYVNSGIRSGGYGRRFDNAVRLLKDPASSCDIPSNLMMTQAVPEENWDEEESCSTHQSSFVPCDYMDTAPPMILEQSHYSPDSAYGSIGDSEMSHYMLGFPNPAGENRCWLNATLQMLFATLFSLPIAADMQMLASFDKCSKLTRTLIDVEEMWRKGHAEKHKTYQMVKTLKEDLAILQSTYASDCQQDVSEFLIILFNYIKKEFEDVTAKDSTTDEISRHALENEQMEAEENPIDKYFSINMIEDYVCKGCKKQRQRSDANLMLFVDLPDEEEQDAEVKAEDELTKNNPVQLADTLNKTFSSEERSLVCETCKHETHIMNPHLKKYPKTVMVQIKRYTVVDTCMKKISTAIRVPPNLTLPQIFENESPSDKTYELIGIISHVGNSVDYGHYTSYVKHDDQWFHYNDQIVSQMSSKDVLKSVEKTAYIIFYADSETLAKDTTIIDSS